MSQSEQPAVKQWEVGGIYFREWYCGDDYCGCSQMQIHQMMPIDPEWPLRRQWKLLWEGQFHTEHESFEQSDYEDAIKAITEYGATVVWPDSFRDDLAEYGLQMPTQG